MNDALLGQATMDEANNRIKQLEKALAISKAVAKDKGLELGLALVEIQRLKEKVKKFRGVLTLVVHWTYGLKVSSSNADVMAAIKKFEALAQRTLSLDELWDEADKGKPALEKWKKDISDKNEQE